VTDRFYSHGKLLLTGEYVVLDGAKALAIPTKKGQSLEVTTTQSQKLKWLSFLEDQTKWIDLEIKLPLQNPSDSLDPVELRLKQILWEVYKLKPTLFESGLSLKNKLEFDRSWGLGSSSTLISNIAQWAGIDAYELLKKTFGGSGYDIACASASGPITFKLEEAKPKIEKASFDPIFKEELFFIHLNKKQNSRESIKHYRATKPEDLYTVINEISQITSALIKVKSLPLFEELVNDHERIISTLIKTPTIKEQLFPNYPSSIKSLGGWGGDFILATGTESDKTYFKDKGYTTILSYKEMVL
jgi:mevalonate kinase